MIDVCAILLIVSTLHSKGLTSPFNCELFNDVNSSTTTRHFPLLLTNHRDRRDYSSLTAVVNTSVIFTEVLFYLVFLSLVQLQLLQTYLIMLSAQCGAEIK